MLRFEDLDFSLQRGVFSASSIMAIVFLLCVIWKFILYGFLVGTVLASAYTGYKLFVVPKLKKKKGVKK